MGVSLAKGQKVSLSKEAGPAGLKAVKVGLGWDVRATDGKDFDLDAVLYMLKGDKVRDDKDFIYYGNKESADGSVIHQGDNLTGEGEGDDEAILVNLDGVPEEIDKLAVCVTIHEAEARGQNFGQVSNAFIRVVNVDGDVELAKFDLGEDASTETALIFGEVYRHNGEWKFAAKGDGFAGGLAPLCENYGVDAG